MKRDAVVAEVRKIRDAHAAKFHYDLYAIVADFKRHERESKAPVVSLPRKRPRFKSALAPPARSRRTLRSTASAR